MSDENGLGGIYLVAAIEECPIETRSFRCPVRFRDHCRGCLTDGFRARIEDGVRVEAISSIRGVPYQWEVIE